MGGSSAGCQVPKHMLQDGDVAHGRGSRLTGCGTALPRMVLIKQLEQVMAGLHALMYWAKT